MPSILFINPASDTSSYYTAEAYDDADGGWVQVADLTIATLAAFVPEGWTVRLVDEAISRVDLDDPADFIGITGKITQRTRMIALAAAFRQRGRTVLIGGSFTSLSPDEMRPHADILVTGEIEEIAPRLFADLESGSWLREYAGGKMVDITLSPPPRWDLYPVHRAQAGALQTTRGCPFACEFCDVIQYQGRKQRHKNVEQVVKELDGLHAAGFRKVFIVDDNFTVHRRWAYTILETLRDWNDVHADDPMQFTTQASMDVARDPDLLNLCREAGMMMLFVGVETMNEDSLRETGKRQNLLMPLTEAIGRILDAGIVVQAGVIAGFDHDTPTIFEDLFEFLQASPLPFAGLGVLTAPEATDLYRRLAREGRLLGPAWEAGAGVFQTNIAPAGMTREALTAGVKTLCGRLYAVSAFEQRMMNMIAAFGNLGRAPTLKPGRPQPKARLFFQATRKIAARGAEERDMLSRVLDAAVAKPAIMPSVMHFFILYEQIRYFLDINAVPIPTGRQDQSRALLSA